MKRIGVFLEIGGKDGHCAHIFDLPGFCMKGRTKERLLAVIPQAALSHLSWLRSHGEIFPFFDDGSTFNVVEEFEVKKDKDGYEIRGWFSKDGELLNEKEFLFLLKLISYAHNDLKERVMSLPRDLFQWQQTPRSFKISQIISRLMELQIWFLSRLKDNPNNFNLHIGTGSISESLALIRTKVMSTLYFYFEQDTRNRKYEHLGELWSLRKVLRKHLESTLECLQDIDSIVSEYWRKCNEKILLGRVASGKNLEPTIV